MTSYIMDFRILYEDNHLIAVFKPAGILTQGDETGDKCLMDEVKEYLKEKYHKPGNVFLGLLHRLDRPVSGIVLFAKTSKGASRLSDQIRSRKFQKIYQALVEGELKEKKAILINYLKKDKEKNFVEVFDEDKYIPLDLSGAVKTEKEEDKLLYAELDYEVVKKIGRNSLVVIQLKTGRPHQIRAQFAHLGHPIVGDVKYGSSQKFRSGEIALCASSLKFKTATSNEEIDLKIEPDFG